MDTSELQIRVLRQPAELDAFVAEWTGFLEESDNGCIYHDPAYVRSFLTRGGDELAPAVFVVRKRGQVIAVAPWFISRDPIPIRLSLIKLGAVRMRRLRLIGDDFALAQEESTDELYQAVFSEIARAGPFDVIELQDLPQDGGLWRAVQSRVLTGTRIRLVRSPEPETCHEIVFPSTFESYMQGLKSRDRTNLRRRQRKLWDQFGGHVELAMFRSWDQVPIFLERLNELYKKCWQSQVYGQQERNSPKEIAFYSQLARRGWFRSYLLIAEGNPLAFQLGVQDAKTYHFLETGYDSQWAELGPGTVLELLVIEELMARDPPQRGTFGFGDADYKRILANSQHMEFANVYLTAGSWAMKARFLASLTALLEGVESVSRRFLKWSRLDSAARRFLRGTRP